ncbi:ABC transporter ATP-binding protein [Leptolyngbya sp. FACHB-1624]|uniref:ABC transporter ATP-binding protein n=1 Tax=Leptolyngbya TaxID=47251 RepID=UPI0018EF7228|nr:ABC transporter ATP-binding protein [Leptolyngbya sp. FACHB-1624]
MASPQLSAPIQRSLAISTQSLTKRFDRRPVVSDVHLDIASGDVYGLIGPNGAGKTTLIRMLALIEEPTIGEIHFNGQCYDRHNTAEIKRYLGYLPDDFPLYDDLNVWDYLDYFARLYRLREPRRSRRLYEVLELVQLTHKHKAPISTLSRGMKQRLGLARTVLHEPMILLLDEPVSGLDPIARMQFREIIKTLQSAGMTILISSHVLSDLAELCTSIGMMELGYLVESASLQDLFARLSQQQILLSTLGSLDDLTRELKHSPFIQSVEPVSETQLKVAFSGNQENSAELLRSLIQAGIPLTEFHCTQEDLETIFLKLGHQQAS